MRSLNTCQLAFVRCRIAGALALLLLPAGLRSDQAPFVPALESIEPIGSNPRANQMTAEEFVVYTADWRERYERFVAEYAPDYSDSEWMLGPPRGGRVAKPLPLARGGQAMAEIVADLDPALHTPEATLGRADYPPEVAVMRHTGHRVVSNAVAELKLWLDTLTGADFPVVQAPTPGERTRLFVGAHFARPRFAADLARLGDGEALDGFAVRARGTDIYIFGATAKGTLNGVYAFLENNSDLIWAHSFSDLGTVFTVNPDLNAVWADALEKPGTIQRGWLGHYEETKDGPTAGWMWRMRNRCNFVVAPGPSPKKAEWGCWREAGGHMLGTFLPEPAKPYLPWIPDSATGELKQPEKIEHYQHNICMTHPELPAAYAKRAVDFFRDQRAKDPGAPLSALRLGVEDPGPDRNYGLCRCERCLRTIQLPDGREIPVQHAVREGLTFRTTQYYLLLEYMARALAAEFPDARFSTYAYYFAAEPPPFQTLVQPWICPYGGGGQLRHRDYRNPLFASTYTRWWDTVYGWSRITDLAVLRDYHAMLPDGPPFAEIVAWDVRALRPMGVTRFANESNLHSAFQQMDIWVASRVYWNPEADVEALRKLYLRRTFREGAPSMERFFGEIRVWWYRQRAYEAFSDLGRITAQMERRQALYALLLDAKAQVRHPVARANVVRLEKTFAGWMDGPLPDQTQNRDAMLKNAAMGRFEPFSMFSQGGMPMAVSVVSIDGKPVQSKPLFSNFEKAVTDRTGWTFVARLRPVGRTAEANLPPPALSLGHDEMERQVWMPAVSPERDAEGGYRYTVTLFPDPPSGFDPRRFTRISLGYPEGHYPEPEGYTPTYALFDLQLLDPRGAVQNATVSHGDAAGSNADATTATFSTLTVHGANATTTGAASCKTWIRFDLSALRYRPEAPATVVITAATDPGWGIAGGPWARTLQLWALNKGYAPGPGRLGTGWCEDELTWRNAPGNLDSGRGCDPEAATLIAGHHHAPGAKAGDRFMFTLPRLGDFLQPDQSVTVMLTIDGESHAYRFVSRQHAGLPGPQLLQEVP